MLKGCLIKMPRCSFCKKNYEFPRGLTLFTNDGRSVYFCSSKCRKNLDLKRDPKKTNWVKKEKKIGRKKRLISDGSGSVKKDEEKIGKKKSEVQEKAGGKKEVEEKKVKEKKKKEMQEKVDKEKAKEVEEEIDEDDDE